jgi:hypothetical protein
MRNTNIKYTYTKKCTDMLNLDDWAINYLPENLLSVWEKINIEKINHYSPRDIHIDFHYNDEEWCGDYDGNKWFYLPNVRNPKNLSLKEKAEFDTIFFSIMDFVPETIR